MVTSYATSQAIKAEVYKFRANVKPYSQFKMNPDEALNLLRSRCSSISESTSDEKFYLTRQDSSPPPGWLNTVDQYMEKRIDDMINRFYVKRGRRLKQRAAFCSRCENALLGLSGAASFCSAQQLSGPLQKVFSTVGGWGGAFTTVSAAFANHIAKEKFNDIAVEYFEAAAKLQDVKDSWPPTAAMSGSPDWEEQVAKSENVILTTIEEWAKAKTGNEDLHLKAAPPVKKDPVWNPDVICGTDESGFYPASDRAEWLVTNKNMTQADAQKKVMVEFPERF
ncbi:unnamed protein product [Pseudo-nitzschia multistriata]|uniref:SMODS and SLOG-associating 2TM effector domain-containing protein n=1 Tax=Pseudo-nitzschia multistriata TaxID=183589 RepID=A0A448ZSS2_9STRA|nr:unnamed protein product [Pseudo-nitzschia multistriata]